MSLPEFSMKELLEAGVHFGHQTHRWNPKMKDFIYIGLPLNLIFWGLAIYLITIFWEFNPADIELDDQENIIEYIILEKEIEILKDNISEMQRQLQQAHVRIKELVKEKGNTQEELQQERQFIQEISGEIKTVNGKLESKMNDYMSSIPDVVDSKPQVLKEGE